MIALWVVLGTVGAYFITSTVLLRFPTLVHKKKKDRFKCRHSSHRGGLEKMLILSFNSICFSFFIYAFHCYE